MIKNYHQFFLIIFFYYEIRRNIVSLHKSFNRRYCFFFITTEINELYTKYEYRYCTTEHIITASYKRHGTSHDIIEWWYVDCFPISTRAVTTSLVYFISIDRMSIIRFNSLKQSLYFSLMFREAHHYIEISDVARAEIVSEDDIRVDYFVRRWASAIYLV